MEPITVYVKSGCPYSASALRLLREKGLEFEVISLTDQPERRDEMIQRAGGKKTTPQIFFGGTHVGGFDELQELDRSQGLQASL